MTIKISQNDPHVPIAGRKTNESSPFPSIPRGESTRNDKRVAILLESRFPAVIQLAFTMQKMNARGSCPSRRQHPAPSVKSFRGLTGGETPVPIPNTAVKTTRGDGTAAAGPWESSTLRRLLIEGAGLHLQTGSSLPRPLTKIDLPRTCAARGAPFHGEGATRGCDPIQLPGGEAAQRQLNCREQGGAQHPLKKCTGAR